MHTTMELERALLEKLCDDTISKLPRAAFSALCSVKKKKGFQIGA